MGIVLGLVAAVLYGAGDYAGGRASERVDVRRVLLYAQSTAAVAAAVLVFIVEGVAAPADLGWGAASGLLTALGLGLLYRALAIGRASVVAPITAVTGAMVPITWGFVTGERPGVIPLTGVTCAIAAAALLARSEEEEGEKRAGIAIAFAAGLALGSSFVCFASVGDESGMWPLLSGRIAAVAAIAVSLARYRGQFALPQPALRFAVVAGVCDVTATVALLGGLRAELAILVAALASLAPGFTVACAFVFSGERISRLQAVGVGLALAGLAMIAAR